MAPKRKVIPKEQREFIKQVASSMPLDEVAAITGVPQELVEEFVEVRDLVPTAEEPRPGRPKGSKNAPKLTGAALDKAVVRQELRNSVAWATLKDEFDPDELKHFEESFVKMVSQMRGDVTATEEVQIFHSAKYEILMSRNLKERQKLRKDIGNLENIHSTFLLQFNGNASQMSDDQRRLANDLETQLNLVRQMEQGRTAEYVKLQSQHADLMKSLKTTRDQRVKEVEDTRKSFIDVIKDLAKRDVQLRSGRHIELMNLAGQVSYDKLGQPIAYDDGNEDSPILSADTVTFGRDPDEYEERDQEREEAEGGAGESGVFPEGGDVDAREDGE